MPPRYRMDAAHSEFAVHAFAGGLLSFLAHSPVFAVRDFAGELCWDPAVRDGRRLVVHVQANSLTLINASPSMDKREIEDRMCREVLEIDRFPTIRFEGDQLTESSVGQYHYRVAVSGLLSLHGVTRQHALESEVRLYSDGIRLTGESSLRLSDFRIQPVTALAGTIRLKDELRLAFNIPAWRET